MKKVLVVMALALMIGFYACEKDESEVDGQSGISGTSHNTGRNCMGCHQFTSAGSVYNKALTAAYPGAKVTLTTLANGAGTVLGTFSVNSSGSFYTSNSINFGTGIYVSVTGSSGTVKYMPAAITSGACNSCHGSSTSKIWAE